MTLLFSNMLQLLIFFAPIPPLFSSGGNAPEYAFRSWLESFFFMPPVSHLFPFLAIPAFYP